MNVHEHEPFRCHDKIEFTNFWQGFPVETWVEGPEKMQFISIILLEIFKQNRQILILLNDGWQKRFDFRFYIMTIFAANAFLFVRNDKTHRSSMDKNFGKLPKFHSPVAWSHFVFTASLLNI